jgi:hypothetical protein
MGNKQWAHWQMGNKQSWSMVYGLLTTKTTNNMKWYLAKPVFPDHLRRRGNHTAQFGREQLRF